MADNIGRAGRGHTGILELKNLPYLSGTFNACEKIQLSCFMDFSCSCFGFVGPLRVPCADSEYAAVIRRLSSFICGKIPAAAI